ncbi:MAG: O-antigen ligase family protein [Candidatus Parcubacteria bacterium]|nr:O-antigen ligase family protein [Candidatus Parcubacteria bacterium]
MGLLKFILIAAIMLFPLGEVARLQLGSGFSLILNDLIVVGLFVIWSVKFLLNRKIGHDELLKPIIIFSCIGLSSLLINSRLVIDQEFFVSASYMLRWVAYGSLYFIIKQFDINFKKKIVNLLTIMGGIMVLGGYCQYFLYPNLRNLYYLGWDEHMHRMFASFLDPNFSGAFFVLYFIFLIGLMFKFIESKNFSRIRLMVYMAISILTLIAIFLTYSRSALIMLLFALFVFLLIKKKKKWIFAVIFIFMIFFAFNYQNFYIENINLFRTASTQARIKSAMEAINIIKRQPILGVGFNSYRYAQIKYGTRSNESAFKSHADAGTDNSFLFILATTGIVGFVSYLYLFFKLFRRLRVKENLSQDLVWLKPVIIASSIGILIDSLFINSLFYPFIMMWFWIMLAL